MNDTKKKVLYFCLLALYIAVPFLLLGYLSLDERLAWNPAYTSLYPPYL